MQLIVVLNECMQICLGAGQRQYQIHSLINNSNTVHLQAENFFNFKEELSYLWSHLTLHIIILKLLSKDRFSMHAQPGGVRLMTSRLRLPDIPTPLWGGRAQAHRSQGGVSWLV